MSAPAARAPRVALVTGATGAIGAAISTRLIDEGTRVALLARDGRRLERLEQRLGAPELTWRARGDVTQPFDLVEARDAIRLRFDADPDLLVVSAGTFRASSFLEAMPSEWDAMIRTNVQGLLHTVQIFAQGLYTAADAGGRADVVLVGSAPAEKRTTAYAVYSAISVAIEQLARHLRDELGGRGVRVHHVAPYYVASQLGTDMADAERYRVVQERITDYQPIDPARVADLVSFMIGLPPRANLAEATIGALRY